MTTMLKLLAVTGSEPITTAEAKAMCRIDDDITADDTLIAALIKAARSQAEHLMGRTVTTAQYERALDAFPDGGIQLAWPTVSSIQSITYIDEAGDLQTLSSSLYTLDAREHPGWAMPAEDTEWPSTLDTAAAVRVAFTSAWAEGGSVPEDVKTWIKLRVATMYKFREQVAAGMSVAELPRSHVDGLLDRWKVWA